MKYTLSQAADATGKNKTTIQRAIKNGKISAIKNENGAYEIDPSELHRIFKTTKKTDAQHIKSNKTQYAEIATELLKEKLKLIELEREREREQMQSTIDDLRKRLDRSEERITALLPAPKRHKWLSLWKK